MILKLSSFNGFASGTVQHHQEFRGFSDTIGKAASTFEGINQCHWFDTWEETPESWSNLTQQVCWSMFRFLDQKSQKQSQKPKTGGRVGTQVHALCSWYSLFPFPLVFPPLPPNTKHNLNTEFQSCLQRPWFQETKADRCLVFKNKTKYNTKKISGKCSLTLYNQTTTYPNSEGWQLSNLVSQTSSQGERQRQVARSRS